MANKKISNNVINAVLYIVIGALFCIFRSGMLNWLLTIAGIVFIALGIYDIIKKNLTNGIIEVVIGVVIILGGWLFVEIVLIVFGALLVIKGIMDLAEIFKNKNRNVMQIIAAIVTIIIGALLIVSKWVMIDWFFIVLGVVFIVNGVLALVSKK